MKPTSAVITGITGQDGRYLAEFLLAKGYQVHGLVNKHHFDSRTSALRELEAMVGPLELHSIDLENHLSVLKVLQKIRPQECYHLASPSFVSYSLTDELQNFQASFGVTHSLAASLLESSKDCRVYFAGSSEMFGEALVAPQDESTPFRPRSLYGIAKVASHNLLRVYREREGMFVSTGILYNHESPRRGQAFVTRKISMAAAAIKLGLQKELVLGNLDVQRDWGSAREYVQAMWRILQLPQSDDFVIATGKLCSVREFAKLAFEHVGLNYQDYVRVDSKHFRVGEKVPLVGNPEKARKILGWKAETSIQQLVAEMVDNDMRLLNSHQKSL